MVTQYPSHQHNTLDEYAEFWCKRIALSDTTKTHKLISNEMSLEHKQIQNTKTSSNRNTSKNLKKCSK